MNAIPRRSGLRRGFTMAELLVVISIIVLLTIIAIPSFKAIIDSTEEAMAESMLRSAVRNGRDAAVHAGEGTDAALVFFYTSGGRLTMTPYVRAGSFQEYDYSVNPPKTSPREVFVPAPSAQPVQLPKGWMVRAYAPLNSIDTTGTGWYNILGLSQGSNPRYRDDKENWVFPETGFFDSSKSDDGSHRQTFMLRFRGGTGELVAAPIDPVLVFAANLDARAMLPSELTADLIALRRSEPERYIRRMLSGQVGSSASGGTARAVVSKLIGRTSSDMIMARAVSQVALYEERMLASALNVDVNRETGCLYDPPKIIADVSTLSLLDGPSLIEDLRSQTGTVPIKVAQWFQGGNVSEDPPKYLDPDYPPSAKLYGIDRYAGALRPLVMQGLASQ